jgi:hypothetical protein
MMSRRGYLDRSIRVVGDAQWEDGYGTEKDQFNQSRIRSRHDQGSLNRDRPAKRMVRRNPGSRHRMSDIWRLSSCQTRSDDTQFRLRVNPHRKEDVLTARDRFDFDLESLPEECPALSVAFCRMIAEACAVCLEEQSHLPGVVMEIQGLMNAETCVHWKSLCLGIADTYADAEVATEQGAIAIALLTVKAVTDDSVVRRSMKGTGFDYWLSRTGAPPYRHDARLEISGLRTARPGRLQARIRQKARQTDRSEGVLPAFIAVVEFSHPLSFLQRRAEL